MVSFNYNKYLSVWVVEYILLHCSLKCHSWSVINRYLLSMCLDFRALLMFHICWYLCLCKYALFQWPQQILLWLTFLKMQDINLNRSIKDALAFEENFFRKQPVCYVRGQYLICTICYSFQKYNGTFWWFAGISWSFSLLWGSSVSQETESGKWF